MYIVYGLEDQRTHEIFYVGVTDDIRSRFLQHLRCDRSNPAKDARIQAMIEAGYLPFAHTFQIVVDFEQARQRESYWMRHYYALGASLTNQVIPVIQEQVIIVKEQTKSTGRLRVNMSHEDQETYASALYAKGMSKKAVIRQVKGYISPGVVSAVFRRCSAASILDITPVEQVKTLVEQGYTQDEIIYLIWHIRKGGSPRYLQAREQYRGIVAQLNSSEEIG